MSTVDLKIQGLLPLKRQFQLLAMPKNMRRRLLFRTAKKVIRDSKKRVRKQVDLNGQPFQKRQRKSRRKMLSGLVKFLKVINNNSTFAEIGFSSATTAQIAAEHQHGATTTVRVTDFSDSNTSRDAPATRRQAKALREAGFKVNSANGKRKKSPSLKWVTENMKVGQAGAALRYLRDKGEAESKQSWTTVLPARSFLGATATEILKYIDQIFKDMKREINYAAR